MSMTLKQAKEKLAKYGQEHVLKYYGGLTEEEKKGTLVIEDRLQAIKTACMLAKKGDIILIAGKGHETFQDIAGVKHHFDDKEIVTEIFNQL